MSHRMNLVRGDCYGVHTGTYAGEILVYIEEGADSYCFLAVPTMVNRVISKLIIENACDKDIIKYVEKLPKSIIKICTDQFKCNISCQ